MKAIALGTLFLAAGVPAIGAAPKSDPAGCETTYTRAHFHAAARSTFDRAFPLERRKRALHRIVRCQRHRSNIPVVRMHRERYRHAWAERFYFERYWALRVPAWLKGRLATIAACESGGNPGAISPGGKYRGRYQFDYGTWGEVGGSGDPAAASAREQDVRAAILYLRAGVGRWPVCGR